METQKFRNAQNLGTEETFGVKKTFWGQILFHAFCSKETCGRGKWGRVLFCELGPRPSA